MVEIVEAPKTLKLDKDGKVLLRARDTIRNWGWTQNEYLNYAAVDKYPEVCLFGAVNHALGFAIDENDDMDAYERQLKMAERLGFSCVAEATNWNDATDRTQQEVEERLERAAYNL